MSQSGLTDRSADATLKGSTQAWDEGGGTLTAECQALCSPIRHQTTVGGNKAQHAKPCDLSCLHRHQS